MSASARCWRATSTIARADFTTADCEARSLSDRATRRSGDAMNERRNMHSQRRSSVAARCLSAGCRRRARGRPAGLRLAGARPPGADRPHRRRRRPYSAYRTSGSFPPPGSVPWKRNSSPPWIARCSARGLRSLADLPELQLLAVSGGGENGAFGAGLLCGWSEQGSRPTFDLVTGISTGALTAPFAFWVGLRSAAARRLHRDAARPDPDQARPHGRPVRRCHGRQRAAVQDHLALCRRPHAGRHRRKPTTRGACC